MLIRLLTFLILFLPVTVFAQDDDFAQRLVLAERMLEIRPAEKQIDRAIDTYVKNYMFNAAEEDKEVFRTAMKRLMNPKALEKVAVDAYAETFTLEELEAMVDYYSKPEAQSASDKQRQLNSRIGPEIANMMDRALIRLRTDPK
ncbi:MAG: DUF2059 domain-containing protein [Alphaproteobacteria bacterium]|nr:DUF2059 domain-containing protein [Alphaproteobacteria bacterium]